MPMARGAHGTRDKGGRGQGGYDDPRILQAAPRRAVSSPSSLRVQEREGEVCRVTLHNSARGDDARRKGSPDGHLTQPRPKLLETFRNKIPWQGGRGATTRPHPLWAGLLGCSAN